MNPFDKTDKFGWPSYEKEEEPKKPELTPVQKCLGVVGVGFDMSRVMYRRRINGEVMDQVKEDVLDGTLRLTFEDGSELPVRVNREDILLLVGIAQQQPSFKERIEQEKNASGPVPSGG